MRIHDMISHFEGHQPFLASKDTFKQTSSTQFKPSLLDHEIPKKLLRDFEHLLKRQAAFYEKVKQNISKYWDQKEIDAKVAFYRTSMEQ